MEKEKRLYHRGFTLIEMIVTITILGVVSLIALPVISNLTANFSKEKSNMCISSIESSLKVYMDSRSEDEFGSQTNGCIEYTYEQAEKDGMISISKNDLDECKLKKSKIRLRVRKSNDKYHYEVYNLDDSAAQTLFDSSSCTMEIDHAGPGVFFNPDGLPNAKKHTKVTILLKDDYGFSPNQALSFRWINADTEEAVSSVTKKEFKNKIMYGASTLEFDTNSPTGLTGNYKIEITPIKMQDTVGNNTTETIFSPIFKFDNTKPNVVIKMFSIKDDDSPDELKAAKENQDVVLNNWFKDGYYVDVGESNDPSGIKSFQWAENPKDNFNTLNTSLGMQHTFDHLENFLLKDKGMRYASISVTDNADNTRIQTITAYNATTYKIHFDPTGGSGGPTEMTKIHGIDTHIPTETPTKSGWNFKGWAIKSDITKKEDVKYTTNAVFSENKEMTLYAVWERSITINFWRNRAHWTSDTTKQCYFYNDHSTCLVKTPDVANISCDLKILDDKGSLCSFMSTQGWSTDPNATTAQYGKNEEITLSNSVDFYSVVTLKYLNGYYAYSPNDHTRVRGNPAADPIVGYIVMGNRFAPYNALSWYFTGDVWNDYYGNANYLWINGYCTSGCSASGWVTGTLLIPWW